VAGKSRKKKDQKKAVDETGREVEGEEAKRVWRRAFEKLGKREERKGIFDNEFEERIEDENREIASKNTGSEGGRLNEKITFEEVRKIIGRLENGKAAGIDEINNEIIKYGGEQAHVVIWQLVTLCFETEKAPEEWAKGMIFPIHKEGDKRNPENYRGISLLSIVGKVYTAVLQARLSSWCEKERIIVEEQGGFRPGRGCVDQLFTLTSVLKNRVGKKHIAVLLT
jgi:hypothetical protein